MEQQVVQTDVDRYVIVEYLAEGGMGAIFLGKKIGMGGFEKEVVLKQLLPEFTSQPEFIDLFLREAKLSAALDHANIVHTIDLVKAGNDYFIVMEYVRGGDLRSILRRIKHRSFRLHPSGAIFVAREILSALAYAHEKKNTEGVPLKLIHRDVSPSNIMVSAAGEVKLADFGIAKASTHKSVFYRVKGKVGYMSPEQAYGDPLDLRSDLYSLAVCLHEMLSGERLFVADLLSTPEQIYSQPVPELEGLPGIPSGLDRVMAKALAFHADNRYQTALEFQDALVQVGYEAAMLFSAPDLAAHLREVCGDDPSAWNKEPDDDADDVSGPRPGTEVLADEARAEFSGIELTSVFTGLPQLLGPEAPRNPTHDLDLDPRGLAYEPTRLHLDPSHPKREKRPVAPSFDFSDLDGSEPGVASRDGAALEPWPDPPRPASYAPPHGPAPSRWGGDEEPTVAIDGETAFVSRQNPAPFPSTPEIVDETKPVTRAEPVVLARAEAGKSGELRNRRERRSGDGEPVVESRDRRSDLGKVRESGDRLRRAEARDHVVDSRERRAVPSREHARLRERDRVIDARRPVIEDQRHLAVDLDEGPPPAPSRRPRARGDSTGSRHGETGVVTDDLSSRRARATQRLIAILIVLFLLGAGGAIVALVGLTGPSLDDAGRGSGRKDPSGTVPPDGGQATVSAIVDTPRPPPIRDRGARAAAPDAAELPSEGRGMLKVTSTPARASVHLDDVLQCETPCTIEELEDRRVYLLSIRRKNHVSWSSLIELKQRRRVTVNAFLSEEPDSRKVGYLMIHSKPAAEVRVDGKDIGRVTVEGRIPLPPGHYEISLSHPRRSSRPQRSVTVKAGQTSVLTVGKF